MLSKLFDTTLIYSTIMLISCSSGNPEQLLHQNLDRKLNFINIVPDRDANETINFNPEDAPHETTLVKSMTPCASSENTEQLLCYKKPALEELKERKRKNVMNETLRGALLAMCGMVLTALALILTVIIFG